MEFAKTTPKNERKQILKLVKQKKQIKKRKKTSIRIKKLRKKNQRKSDIYGKALIKRATKTEKILKQRFDEDGMFYTFQKKFFSHNFCFITDFWFKSITGNKYIIEIDGKTHLSESAKRYDEKRTKLLEKYRDCKVIRFTNEQVLNDIDSVIDKIYSLMPKFIN